MTLMPDSSNNHSAVNTDIPSAGRLLSDPPGLVLKRARQARKLDLETAADQLNLSASVVRALEEDAYDRLPSPTFIRGYIRCYARLLKLSGDDLVRSYERVDSSTTPEPQADAEETDKASTGIKPGWIWLTALLLVIVIAGWLVLTLKDTPQQPVAPEEQKQVAPEQVNTEEAGIEEAGIEQAELKPTIVQEVAADAVGGSVDSEIVGSETAAPESTVLESTALEDVALESVVTENVVTENVVTENVETVPSITPEAVLTEETITASIVTPVNTPVRKLSETNITAAESVTATNIPRSEPSLSTLTLAFSGECWVEVWDATGKRIYANLRRAGQKVSLQGVAPIEVKLGNGGVVKLEFNGNPVLFASSKRTSVAHVTLGGETP